MDVDAALLELQRLVAVAERSNGGGTDVDPLELQERLRTLEQELLRRARTESRSRPREHSGVGRGASPPSPSPRASSHANPSLDRRPSASSMSVDDGGSSMEAVVGGAGALRQALVAPVPSVARGPTLSQPRAPSVRVCDIAQFGSGRPGTTQPAVNTTASATGGGSGAFPPSDTRGPPAAASFRAHYESDDRQRLLFVIDALANELNEERRKRHVLQETVIPGLLSHVAVLEDQIAHLQEAVAVARHAAHAEALRASQQRISAREATFDSCVREMTELANCLRHREAEQRWIGG